LSERGLEHVDGEPLSRPPQAIESDGEIVDIGGRPSP
jgi:hypothetical protein